MQTGNPSSQGLDLQAVARRVALPACAGALVGGAYTAARSFGRVDPPTALSRSLTSAAKAGSIFGVFTFTKVGLETQSPRTPFLNSAAAGALAVAAPNLLVPERTKMLQRCKPLSACFQMSNCRPPQNLFWSRRPASYHSACCRVLSDFRSR